MVEVWGDYNETYGDGDLFIRGIMPLVDRPLGERFQPSGDGPTYLAFSDGTVLRADFHDDDDPDRRRWSLTIEREGSEEWVVEPDPDGGGDHAVTRARIFWCVGGDFHCCED